MRAIKKCICLVLALSALMSLCMGSAYAEVVPQETVLTIEQSDVLLHINAKLLRGEAASVVILKPGAEEPVKGDTAEAVLKKIAYIGQIKPDEDGNIVQSYYLPGIAHGEYTIRVGQCYDISCQVVKEFFAPSWSDDVKNEYIIPMYWLRQTSGTSMYDAQYDYDIMAERAKEHLNGLPEGQRFIIIGGALQNLVTKNMANQNYLWWDTGVAEMKGHMEQFFGKYKEIGGLVDGVIIDFEKGLSRDYLVGEANTQARKATLSVWNEDTSVCSCKANGKDDDWHIKSCNIGKNVYASEKTRAINEMINAIIYDSRFESEGILEKLKKKGFDETYGGSLYAAVWQALQGLYANDNMTAWDYAVGGRINGYLNTAIFDVVRLYYPEASCSDYGSATREAAHMFNRHGFDKYKAGNAKSSGTHSAPDLYGREFNETPPYWYDGEKRTVTGFTVVQNEVNMMKSIIVSEGGQAIQPWISNPQYEYRKTTEDSNGNKTVQKTSITGNTPWFRELIFHVGLLNPDPFLYWGPRYYTTDDETYVFRQAQMMSDILDELNSVAGYKERVPLTETMHSWNLHFILTGMRVSDSGAEKNIWRITPDLSVEAVYNLTTGTKVYEGVEGMTRESFCTDRQTPTFAICGTTITFPGGRIIEDKNTVDFDGNASSYGYWVETPPETEPVVTYDANAFEIEEGFETEILVYRDDGMTVTQVPETGSLTIRFSYKNRSGEVQKVQTYAAFYSGNKLMHVGGVFKGDVQFGEDGYKLYKLEELPSGTDKIKLFVWDGEGNLRSMTNAIELLPQTAEE